MSIFGTPAVQNAFVGFGASPSLSVTMNTALGDLICVAFMSGSAGFVSVTDTIGNTYVQAGSVLTSPFQGFKLRFFYCLSSVGANASNAIQVLFSSNSLINMVVWDVPISGGTASFDTTATVTGNPINPVTSASFSTVGSDEIVIAACMSDNTSGVTFSAGSGYSLDASTTTNSFDRMGAQHITYSSPQTGITSSITPSAAVDAAYRAVAFNAVVSGGAAAEPVVCIMQ